MRNEHIDALAMLEAALKQHRRDMVAALHETNHSIRRWQEMDDETMKRDRIADLAGEAAGRASVIDLFDVLLRENHVGTAEDEWNR